MNELQIFNNDEFGEIRMVLINDKPYAVGVDIAKNLGYKNTRDAISRHCKGVVKFDTIKNAGGYPEKLIPEGDIYRLIVKAADQSQNKDIKEKAEKFEKWIFDDVLPSIRKHGVYATDELLNNPDFLIEALQELKKERAEKKALQIQSEQQAQLIGELKPKADYTDTILKNKSLVTITQIAKDYGYSGRAFNQLLNDLGVQYYQSGQWLLYSQHHGKGYTHSETFRKNDKILNMITKWTQKGRLFLYNLLKDEDIVPLIERRNY